MECKICHREFEDKAKHYHHEYKCKGIRICDKCGCHIKTSFDKHVNSCDGTGPKSQRPKGPGRGWSKGKTYEEIHGEVKANDIKNEISEIAKLRGGIPHTEETKKLLSAQMVERYKNGWEASGGRCKKFDYISPIAGKVKLDGTWEVKVAEFLDNAGVIWQRNKKRFEYYNDLKNKISTYCPDFYVEDWKTYIEVKGFILELDQIKWRQFTEPLLIWDKNKLQELGLL